MCRITISRFYRDRGIFDLLETLVFPKLFEKAQDRGEESISCWCIGAASGEEPYSISLLWEFSRLEKQGVDLEILATEIDQHMINRARAGCYPASSIKDLPDHVKKQAFSEKNKKFCLQEKFRKRVRFLQQDIRNDQPDSIFDLILCRNLVFTYFSQELQAKIVMNILKHLRPGGFFIIGSHEELPGRFTGLEPGYPKESIYQSRG
jgi:chemotaxis protein methyltransferase CheR